MYTFRWSIHFSCNSKVNNDWHILFSVQCSPKVDWQEQLFPTRGGNVICHTNNVFVKWNRELTDWLYRLAVYKLFHKNSFVIPVPDCGMILIFSSLCKLLTCIPWGLNYTKAVCDAKEKFRGLQSLLMFVSHEAQRFSIPSTMTLFNASWQYCAF